MNDMLGKVVLVTGATSGIGRAAAMKFAEAGATVVVTGRHMGRLMKVGRAIEDAGAVPLTVPADLSVDADVERVVQEAGTYYGGIDVLVNAAGIIGFGALEETTLEQWDQILNVDVRSMFYLTKCALPYLKEREGNVINVSSVAGLRAFPGLLAYCVANAAVDQFTRCLALDLAQFGIRVNAVNPGVVETKLHINAGMGADDYEAFLERSKATHPLGRIGKPEEIADLIFFLASPEAGWITGATVSIDGGRAQTCLR